MSLEIDFIIQLIVDGQIIDLFFFFFFFGAYGFAELVIQKIQRKSRI